ncbi:Hypothetical protein A7982_07229 [Minicystis rosea]|nr:Hypothetical protein A7982_07229 [Minicystis rosea]
MLSAFQDPKQDPATCSQCTVGTPYGQWCVAAISAHSDDACTSDDAEPVFFGLNFCSKLGQNDYGSAIGTAAGEAVYYCDTPDQTPTVPPIAWNTAAVGCADPSPAVNGCGSTAVCVPKPQAPFGSRLCVSKDGDTNCPMLTYTVKSVFYASALDTRSCSPCGYSRTPITCSASAVMFSDDACTDTLATMTDFTGACVGIPGQVRSTMMLDATFDGTPSCSPEGGQPIGAVAGAGATTVCCTP